MEVTPGPTVSISPAPVYKYGLFGLALLCLLLVVGLGWVFVKSQPPADFPVETPVVITEGSSISRVVKTLYEAKVIKSELLLYSILSSQYKPSDIKASTYVFDKPYNAFAVAEKLATGDFTSNLVRLTHKEGESVKDLAASVNQTLPTIETETFITEALPYEGKLFPETYFLPPYFTSSDVIATLLEKYETFMAPWREKIAAGSLTEEQVIILASIIEREANSPESMGMVSGILQNRLALDMPLQTDASIEYVLSKSLGELTPEDLKIDSPYNTYLYKGLPPTPIGNPGAVAIKAVLEPTPSDYLFYLTGNDGNFYYATNYNDHKRNIARYLR